MPDPSETTSSQDPWTAFLHTHYRNEILKVAHGYPAVKAVAVDFDVLDKHALSLADELLNRPDDAICRAEDAANSIEAPINDPQQRMNVRFTNLPASSKRVISRLRSSDVGRFIAIDGIVKKATDVRPKLVVGVYKCNICGAEVSLPQTGEKMNDPYICEECEKKSKFTLLDKSIKVDFQKARIQENFEELPAGEHPRQIDLFLEDDLAGKARPGERIEAIGILRTAKKYTRYGSPRVLDLYVEVNNYRSIERLFEDIELTKKDIEEIQQLAKDPLLYVKIRDSIAPHIYGQLEIKEAVALQIFGSPPTILENNKRLRGDSHILLVGEPAVGKSEILQHVAKELAPRGIYVSGKGSSAAGLTAAAVKDDFGEGGWSLEAGAMVLADNGLLSADEFDKMEEDDRNAMHEALEQQQVSIAKAGIIASFPARCSVLAAANPKYGRFDKYRAISEQIELTPPLLSRFDLIFFVEDDPKHTRSIAERVVLTASAPEKIVSPLPPTLLRKYIAYAKQTINPVLSEAAGVSVIDFYVEMRGDAQNKEDAPIPITTRQLWAVIRLARASARIRLSDIAEQEDVERAIRLVKSSLSQAGMDIETGQIDVDKIMVGVTKSQRDRIVEVVSIIKELEKEFGTARKSEIVQRCSEKGISERQTEDLLEKLKRDGNIYEPKNGSYKVVV